VSVWRRFDHVALVVHDTESALEYFAGTLGMTVTDTEELETPPVRLTFLDAGGVTVQLVEPLAGNASLTEYLAEHGEGLHHVCFEVDDLIPAVRQLSGGADPELVIEGRRTRSAFVPNRNEHGLLIELTQQRGAGQQA
jgi:methylmalonyl-CoA/ethylmalonyl-CoA epimerase